MNKREASKLAESATLDDIRAMFKAAQGQVTDWTKPSRINSQIDRGAAFNVLSSGIATATRMSDISKRNCIWEFGEYLPNYKKQEKKARQAEVEPLHQEPCPLTW